MDISDANGLENQILYQELDAVSEVGNITMGTASTPLSELLRVPVKISNPFSYITSQEKVFSSFEVPYMIIRVDFIKGLQGFNVLIIRDYDIAVIADLMTGGSGVPDKIEITELALSAASEAMNQMAGAAATALSKLFNEVIEITPPKCTYIDDPARADFHPLPTDGPVVVVKFTLSIGEFLKTTIMQITTIETARVQAEYLLRKIGYDYSGRPVKPQDANNYGSAVNELSAAGAGNAARDPDLPVAVSLVAYRMRLNAGDIESLKPGSEIHLNAPGAQVELVANGTVVAVGELSDGKFRVTRMVKGPA